MISDGGRVFFKLLVLSSVTEIAYRIKSVKGPYSDLSKIGNLSEG